MPATRAVTRHGSRQPQPYPQDLAGPSNNNPIVLPDDEGPPRRRSAVERKVSKSNSKQKARAPLPPAAEIIEISSDEDEPPLRRKPTTSSSVYERRIKELQEENKRLMAAAAAAKAAHAQALAAPPAPPPSKVQAPPPAAKTDKFLSAVEDHISCEVCTLKMWHPFTLPCGHTFCKDCLVDWFNTALIQHLSAHPTYNAQRLIPSHWRNALAQPNLPDRTRVQYEREIAVILSTTPQPKYSCPTCRVLVKTKPAENFVVKHLVRTIAGVQGESCPQEAPRPRIPGRPVEGAFDGFFPYL